MPKTAQQKIRELFNSNVGDRRLVYDFNLFDRSVTQKLWSTDYYLRQLLDLHIYDFQVFITESATVFIPESATQSAGSKTIQIPLLDTPEYCRHLNRLFDGFFMNYMSTLDTLAHEIFTLYDVEMVPPKIYITTARDMLLNAHPTSKAGKILDRQLRQVWFKECEPFRHCTTHESLIRYDDMKFSFDDVTNRYELAKKVKLPDDPQVRPFTYRRNREANKYCQSVFNRLQLLVTQVYKAVLSDIRDNGNTLPIPTA